MAQAMNKVPEDAMTALKLSKWWTVAAAFVMVAVQAAAQQTPVRVIVVSLEDRKLALVEDGQAVDTEPGGNLHH
jgi:hypothetical protein